ncbi:unnamed protein product [Paramecium octaurelia]|uniref:Uncharacterized protein n=1 Tax=Paramecium octaurelia TaxID=43137 RepID=A0A8S1WCX1_PAROT|nr:unnamed protein product [Paramecium octaurelia]
MTVPNIDIFKSFILKYIYTVEFNTQKVFETVFGIYSKSLFIEVMICLHLIKINNQKIKIEKFSFSYLRLFNYAFFSPKKIFMNLAQIAEQKKAYNSETFYIEKQPTDLSMNQLQVFWHFTKKVLFIQIPHQNQFILTMKIILTMKTQWKLTFISEIMRVLKKRIQQYIKVFNKIAHINFMLQREYKMKSDIYYFGLFMNLHLSKKYSPHQS